MDEKKLLKEGWIKALFRIEVLATSAQAAKSALEKHVEKLEKEKDAFLVKKDFGELREVENPLPRIRKGWSYIVELELLARSFEKLISLVISYGPSSIELLEPEKLEIKLPEAQAILNSLAELIHRFAAAGLGGILISA
ncbi:MAG: hypothetical protein DRP12_02950 [Candidatus Aenigmatarchaeota archaeon]|nr:MAG: hypothetical protein DRP12_02950 [Candidatus Aenigmarchaeota archaeon]